MGSRSGLPVPIYPLRCTSLRSSQFWVAYHDILDLVGNDREFHQNSFWYISPRVVGHEMLFLCLSFAVPSTTRSLHSDYAVRDWESTQSPLVKILAGFAFNQEMSAKAIDHSPIPIKKAFWALHFWNCFAQLELLYIDHFTNQRFRIVTEWVVDVILLEICLKCFSMRMTLDLLHEFANTEVFCLFHNCMW